jgi:putative ABC transport system substrate-binding protein
MDDPGCRQRMATAWAIAARAHQPAMPVVGFLSSQSPDNYAPFPSAFRAGLSEAGFVEGKNVVIEYRWARGKLEQLPVLAADLVHRGVNVIAATGGVTSGLAAKAATVSIPIVFTSGEDPVQAGLVSNLNRPGGNVTGVSWFSIDIVAKRFAILHQIVPADAAIALLVAPKEHEGPPQVAALTDTAHALERRLVFINASTPLEIEQGFAAVLQQGARGVIVGSGAFFINQRAQIIALAAQHAVPCIYSTKDSPAAGGLMSYGNNLEDAYRHNGIYVGRILKGDKPGNLPIDRATKFELVINLKTAKTLGLAVPDKLLALADEVIE